MVTSLATHGQIPEPKRYNFTHYTESSGLNSYQVNSTLQDADGFIWIATNEGLQRFDGLRYKNFDPDPENPFSIPSKSILQILADGKEKFWILTAEGEAGIFDTSKFNYRPVRIKLDRSLHLDAPSLVKRLIADEYGHVFLLVEGKEILTYNEKLNEFSAAHNFFPVKPEWAVMDFLPVPGTKKYWMALGPDGLALYDQSSDRLSYFGSNSGQENIIDHYRNSTSPYRIYIDQKKRFWQVGQDVGLPKIYCYDLGTDQVILEEYGFKQHVGRYHEIHQIFEQADGSIWLSGINILANYQEKDNQFQQVYNAYEDDQSIYFVVITSLNEDRERNIWVSTANNGVFRFNPSEEFFRTIELSSKLRGDTGSGAPLSFAEDLDQTILVGVWNDQLYRYDADLYPVELDIDGYDQVNFNPVLSICPSQKEKVIWMASPEGIYRYDQLKRSVTFQAIAGLKSRIRTISEDKLGNLWIGLQEHGLYKWDAQKGKLDFQKGISQIASIPYTRINHIMVDSYGMVWVGTSGAGLYIIDPESGNIDQKFEILNPAGTRISERTISTLLEYNDSIVLIGSRYRLLTYNRRLKKLSVLGRSESISGSLSSMEKDTAGYVWLSTTAGLYRINVEKKVFIKFNREDGIRNDYFVMDASYRRPDGSLLFGATRSMVSFDPSQITLETSSPQVKITDFKVMNRSLSIDSLMQKRTIHLSAQKNSIAIDLSAMSYNTVYAIRYKLEGLDRDWRVADRTHQIMYPYLPSGSYTLLVNSLNTEGVLGDEPLELYIEVATPIWKSWWFYGIMALLIGALLFWLDKARIQRKVAVHRMRNDIAVNLNEEVNIALNNINILSEMAKIKAKSDPQKSTEFIEQIHNKSHNMIIAMDDMLWAISPENDSMDKTIERLREYIDSLKNRHEAQIELNVDNEVKLLKLDMLYRHEAFILFKEMIRELVFLHASHLEIHLSTQKSILYFTIQFHPENCNKQDLYDLKHHRDLEKRLNVIGGSLDLELHNGKSFFELQIPLSK